jgi:hypothetical protein
MAYRHFDNWLKTYLDYASKISETPLDMLFWAGVSAVSGALQRRVFIDQGRFQLYPNFFIVFVADAGVIQKSTTINTAIGLLKKVEGIIIAPDATTWEGFIKFMEENHQSDGTLTENLDAEQSKTSAVTISASELSTFIDPQNKPMLSALTKLWDNEDVFVKLTKFSGTEEIEKPCVNLIGGTTPSWMRDSFDRWSREGGFVSRTIFIYGAKKRQLVAFPKKNLTPDYYKTQTKLIEDLGAIGKLSGEYILDPHMMEIAEEWYRLHNEKVLKSGYVDSSGFKDRKQAHILKLAMVLAASQGERMLITPELWGDAVEWIERAEQDFPKAFATVDQREELRSYFDLLEEIKKAGEAGIEKKIMLRRFSGRFNMREVSGALDMMAKADLVTMENKLDGRQIIKYNPQSEDGTGIQQ